MSVPRVDVVTIFPDYLAPLDLSLIGKARTSGLVDLRVHDLREHAHDRHRTVDDSPFGGGAGMVMRPDVWERAIEATASHRRPGAEGDGDGVDEGGTDGRALVVLVPTPSGRPLTQAFAQELADELGAGDRVRAVVACGRYEGIDARLVPALRERSDVDRVVEFSLGDFVLNGGEVAALALLEAVVRLLPGVLGNPESVVEESFAHAAVLEYPVFTRPARWEDREVPPVLLSGDHGAVARWRRAQSLTRTVQRRPELLARLDGLDAVDLATLAAAGVVPGRHGRLIGPVTVRRAVAGEGALVADLAATTFALACPDETTMADIRAHVAAHLSPRSFEAHLAAADDAVLLACDVGDVPLGYAVVRTGAPSTDAPAHVGTGAELSKCYVLPRAQGSGAARALVGSAVRHARAAGADHLWLGVNARNAAAIAFYTRSGFTVVGERTYRVGEVDHHDHVMVKDLAPGVAD